MDSSQSERSERMDVRIRDCDGIANPTFPLFKKAKALKMVRYHNT
jgi:hypothetical protein